MAEPLWENHTFSPNIVCPYCGWENMDSFEAHEGEQDCPDCGNKFSMGRDVDITYSTSKIEEVSNG